MKKLFTSVCTLLICCIASAQNAEISGTIKDADTKEGIASASVRYGKSSGTITDAEGKFRLSLPAGEYEIIFSSIGFKKEREKVILTAGEKKRMEFLQLAMLQPRFAILDETDSGLDSDAVRVVSEGLAKLAGPKMGVLIITHHERLLEFNPPQFTHVMLGGRIVETGDAALAHDLHANGYANIRARHPQEDAENAKVQAAAAV